MCLVCTPERHHLIMKIIQALLIVVTAACVAGKPGVVKNHVRDTEDACQSLQQAGLALYDDMIQIYPRSMIEEMQSMSPVNLLDRDDAADFFCNLAGVECIEDLALLLNMPEPMVREFYYSMQMNFRQSYRPAPGRNILQELFLVWDILLDIVEFADQVGYSGQNIYGSGPDYMAENNVTYDEFEEELGEYQPYQRSERAYPETEENEKNVEQEGPYGPHGPYEWHEQGGAETVVKVDLFVALDFAERMEAKYGEDWENVLYGAISRNDGMHHENIDVDIDPTTLAAAIVFSSDEIEFATSIEMPQMIIMTIARTINVLHMTLAPVSDLTLVDVYGKVVNAAKVAFDLGLFALN